MIFFSKIPSFYGVADNVTQVLKNKRNYNYFIKSKEKFILTYFTVTKDDDSDWRWGKWGKYIGKQKPKYEHIGDEKDIEKVICYHFYGIKCDVKKLSEHRRNLLRLFTNFATNNHHT